LADQVATQTASLQRLIKGPSADDPYDLRHVESQYYMPHYLPMYIEVGIRQLGWVEPVLNLSHRCGGMGHHIREWTWGGAGKAKVQPDPN
jgi:hypothetical protein